MTSDDTPETLLTAVRDQAFMYVHKPVAPATLLRNGAGRAEAPEPAPIEVVSTRPDWVELVVPCTREAAERIHAVMAQPGTKLDPSSETRSRTSFANCSPMRSMGWQARSKSHGAHLVPRAKRMLSIASRTRARVQHRRLPHAAIGQPSDDPIAHMQVREDKVIRPGGFGLLMVRANVDELLYNEKRNEVVFVKYLDEGSQ